MRSKPNLAIYFENEVAKVYGNRPNVSSKQYDKFRTLELGLMESGVRPWHYAAVVVRLWKNWVEDKELRTLPMHVFLGVESLRYYIRYRRKLSVEIVGLESGLNRSLAIFTEQEFAKFYMQLRLNGYVVNESQALADFMDWNKNDPAIQAWMRIVEQGKRLELKQEVIRHIIQGNKLYRTDQVVNTYEELLKIYADNVVQVIYKLRCKAHNSYGSERQMYKSRIAKLERELWCCNVEQV
jgi:hypothetical protein